MTIPCDILVFGGTGDLALNKLLPALYHLFREGRLHNAVRIIALARRPLPRIEFLKLVERRCRAQIAPQDFSDEVWHRFSTRLDYFSMDAMQSADFGRLARFLGEPGGLTRVYYLATAPNLFVPIATHLQVAGLVDSEARIVLEKPIGHSLESATTINSAIGAVFAESQVFRIDHYLGKETVQNILAFRFANNMFEPVWNSNYVDHVQITMAEDIGIGSRAGYYDGIGAARDVIQNHLLQLMALIAMEEPVSFDAKSLRIEKQKILANARPPERIDLHTAHAQYTEGWAGGEPVEGYLQEDGIPADSNTETYAAMRIDIGTRRWANVPFYLRVGKRLGRRVTEVAVVFKRAPHQPFSRDDTEALGQNALVMRIQPDEGVTLRFGAKVPGTVMEIRDVNMDFAYGGTFVESSPEAYERLILDVLLGDPPLFPRHEEVEMSWQILDPIIKHWERQKSIDTYQAGTWGPASADEMIARDGRRWRRP